ncbi:nucleoside-diphosphate sugar epimerase [Daejeonella sp. H1SJ63]|uniref:nucleoside-diphosphate sugar epimerase n=1 Tax=Daejeonella sp. H1SJ63 TaxID=3034145 RepID=UPI0023EAEEE9|nr:nucleoside-diphosphate sugar epimerase [Daejeonella sp. H1SJ63]
MSYKVILVGGSGLIGSCLLSELRSSDEISDILLVARSASGISDPKIRELILNFDDLDSHAEELKADIIFSCLGTTTGKTPDANLYRKIDLEYPLKMLHIGMNKGLKQFHIVTSIGADAASSNSYLKLKGELENSLKSSGVPSLHIYQPSFLKGERREKRPAEIIMNILSVIIDPLLIGPLKKYKSIKAKTVAKTMLKQSLKDLKGTFIYPSIQIQNLS